MSFSFSNLSVGGGKASREALIIVHLLFIFYGRQIIVRAHMCEVGREKDASGTLKWFLPYDKPCRCTSIRLGGMTTGTPKGSFQHGYVTRPLISSDVAKIRDHYGLQCNDEDKPKLTCPEDIVEKTDRGFPTAMVVWKNQTATDDSGNSFDEVCSPDSGTLFPIGNTEVTCTSNNESGNAAQCTFSVTIIDEEPPNITCPVDIASITDKGLPTAVVTWVKPNASDNSRNSSDVMCTPDSGVQFPIGQTTVTCKVTDGSGHTAHCNFLVSVTDEEIPQITCPTNIATVANKTLPTAVVTWVKPNASDNSQNTSDVMCTPDSGAQFPIGQTTVTCNVTDRSGNVAVCNFSVNVKDKEEPQITCPDDIANITDKGLSIAVVTWVKPNTSDNSGYTAEVICTPESGTDFPIGQNIVTCNTTDASGNTALCNFAVNVTDKEKPQIICAEDVVMIVNQPTDTPVHAVVVSWNMDNIATDNSGQTSTITCSRDSGTQFSLGYTIVMCKTTDGAGNRGVCSFQIYVAINLLLGKETKQISTEHEGVPENAVDGNSNGNYHSQKSCTHTGNMNNQWWVVDLGDMHCIGVVRIYNRISEKNRLVGAVIRIGPSSNRNNPECGTVTSDQVNANQKIHFTCNMRGQYLSVHLTNQALTLCEVEAVTGICDECYTDPLGQDYRGLVSITRNGTTCQLWTSNAPHPHNSTTPSAYPNAGLGEHNYCRNPDSEPDGPWCYTSDPAMRWEYCNVDACV